MIPRWEHFDRGADIGLRGIADSKAEAFAQAALALTAAVADPASVRSLEPVEVRCRGTEDDALLAEWLRSVITEMATRRMLFSRYEVRLDDGVLSARAWGEGVERRRHDPAIDLRSAALSSARVARHGDGWIAQAALASR
jgi:tRNA nucleotidyltransferase (CCA-adding enzyme)